MIDTSSRYASVGTYVAEDSSGEHVEALELRPPVPARAAVFHTPDASERLDHLAHRYLGDSRRFWRLCDASDELDPFDVLHPGRPLPIPSLG